MKFPRLSERAKDVWMALAVAGLAALVVVCLAATLWTVSEHNGEIHQIAKLEQQIRADQVQHNNELQTIHKDAQQIERYALELSQEIAANHVGGTANLQAICNALPGCVLPSSSSP